MRRAAIPLLLGVMLGACGSNVVLVSGDGGSGVGGGSSSGGGGVETICEPGAVESCYGGPDATAGMGTCVAGERRCRDDGSGFGACEGEVAPAPDECATPEDEDCDGVTTPCPGAHLWSVQHASPLRVYTESVAVDHMGAVVVGGAAHGELDVGGGPQPGDLMGEVDPYLARYDAAGTLLFDELYLASGSGIPGAVAVDAAGDMLLAGHFQGTQSLGGPDLISKGNTDAFVAKLTAGGSDLWSHGYGGDWAVSFHSVATDPAGNVVLFGDFGDGPMTVVAGSQRDLVVVKLDPAGSLLFSKQLGTALGQQHADDLAVDAQGNIVIAGHFVDTIDFGGGVLASQNGANGYVAKLDANGNHVFSRVISSTHYSSSHGVAVDARGAVYVTGMGQGVIDFGGGPVSEVGEVDFDAFVVKYDEAGGYLWAQRWGTPIGSANAQALDADGAGRVAVCGYFAGALTIGRDVLRSAGDDDAFLAQLSAADGEPMWSQRFGGEGSQGCADLAVGQNGSIAMVGVFEDSVSFGGDVFTAAEIDGYVAVFAP